MTIGADQVLTELVSRTRALMLDFDGPVCSVFAGYPAPEIADQLRRLLGQLGVPVSAELKEDDDPLSIYRHSVTGGPAVVATVHEALVAAELEAVATAAPTPGAVDVIAAAVEGGQRLAVVSNNAADAVAAYLQRHRLADQIEYVAARRTPDPTLMKPNPRFLIDAATALGVAVNASALVGDSATDAEAAKAAGAYAIGLANKPGKARRLSAAGADVVIESMTTLAASLREGQWPASGAR